MKNQAILEISKAKSLVKKFGSNYLPLFSPQEVSRDKFMQLRKELINLGCDKHHVIPLAKKLSMDVLNLKDETEYHAFILNHTYLTSKKLIKENILTKPIQDLNDPQYTHTNLFSSIYGFEIGYLKQNGLTRGIADVGCGDGLLLQLLKDEEIHSKGYEVEIKAVSHKVSISKITDVEDISEVPSVVILNHVLEHIPEHPNAFLSRMIEHFDRVKKDHLKAILISLPFHLSLQSHLASDHRWVCYTNNIPKESLEAFKNEGIHPFFPETELPVVAKKHGFNIIINKDISTYVIERKS